MFVEGAEMAVTFGSQKTLLSTLSPTPYGFNLNGSTWYKCREEFSKYYTSDSYHGFFFSIKDQESAQQSANVANFITKTEALLDLSVPINEYSKFSLTNRPFAVWIEPGSFWKTPMKISLFTILLRCGVNYCEERDNYEDALKSDPYGRETFQAILRFLFGNTEITVELKNSSGWRDYFRLANLESMRTMLVRPKDSKSQQILIGQGSIWN